MQNNSGQGRSVEKGISVEREIRMCVYVTGGRPEREEESQRDTDEGSQQSGPLASDTTQGSERR